MTTPILLIMAGGTGGHIMPGLAVAEEMRARGWEVKWLGSPDRMEGRLVPAHGIVLLPLYFSGLRGKGMLAVLRLPFTLSVACLQAFKALRRSQANVILGLGGYVAFPGGLMARLLRRPLVIHEQNAVAGTSNRYLSRIATTVMTGFPETLARADVVGNPVQQDILGLSDPKQRYQTRSGPLRVLVVGGSLGAHALNTTVPPAIAALPAAVRPQLWHQSGERHIATLKQSYGALNIAATCSDFIEDMAEAYAWADLVICRAGAMTVAEVAVVGVAALFIPLPHAIDDHQTANARYLSECGGAWLMPQDELHAAALAAWLSARSRAELAEVARHAHEHACPDAAERIADICRQLGREST